MTEPTYSGPRAQLKGILAEAARAFEGMQAGLAADFELHARAMSPTEAQARHNEFEQKLIGLHSEGTTAEPDADEVRLMFLEATKNFCVLGMSAMDDEEAQWLYAINASFCYGHYKGYTRFRVAGKSLLSSKVHGANGAKVKKAKKMPVKEWAIKKYESGTLKPSVAADRMKDEFIAYAKAMGLPYMPTNAKRLLTEWFKEADEERNTLRGLTNALRG